MKVDDEVILDAIQEAKDNSVLTKEDKPDKERNFDETIDLIVIVRDIDLNNPNNRIDRELLLPNPIKGNKSNVCFIVKDDMEVFLKDEGYPVINDDRLQELQSESNKEKKKLVKQYDYFVARGDLMVNVARTLARFLGQQGKMPKPQPKGFGVIRPDEDLEEYLKRLPRVVKISMKKHLQVQTKVGKKSQDNEQILENINSVLSFLDSQLPYGITTNVEKIYMKTTMGQPVKMEDS